MADLLSDVKSRLIDKVFTTVPLRGRDPFEAISLHATVSNQLWWIYSGPQMREPAHAVAAPPSTSPIGLADPATRLPSTRRGAARQGG